MSWHIKILPIIPTYWNYWQKRKNCFWTYKKWRIVCHCRFVIVCFVVVCCFCFLIVLVWLIIIMDSKSNRNRHPNLPCNSTPLLIHHQSNNNQPNSISPYRTRNDCLSMRFVISIIKPANYKTKKKHWVWLHWWIMLRPPWVMIPHRQSKVGNGIIHICSYIIQLIK